MVQQICTRCIMDINVPEICFDREGVCQFCKMHDEMNKLYPVGAEGEEKLQKLVADIKSAGGGSKYDCICGVSGGRDSTWTLYTAVKLGLRPLAVHFDNGWNSEVAVRNIKNATEILGVDLETVIADWEEFRELQLSFLKASVPDVEIPTDVAIHSVLHKVAAKENIKYVLNGHSFRTEGIAPRGWTYMDGRYIEGVHRKFSAVPLRDFHNFGIKELLFYSFIKRIKVIPILNYLPYNQKEVSRQLENELEWQYYGGHHHESTYTEFIQSYFLPRKFNIDKRKNELSALIRSGQITREEGLNEISIPYRYKIDLIEYILTKFNLNHEQWEKIYNELPRSFFNYPTYFPLIRAFKWPLMVMAKINLLPKLLYLKYLG